MGMALPKAMTLTDAAADRMQILAGVRQYPMRVKCATLAWHTMDKAMNASVKEDLSV